MLEALQLCAALVPFDRQTLLSATAVSLTAYNTQLIIFDRVLRVWGYLYE